MSESAIQLSANAISLSSALIEGRNDLELYAVDNQGFSLRTEATLWAGSNTFTTTVLDENGQSANGVVVKAKLGDDQSVEAKATTSNGEVVFQNIPGRTIFFEALSSDNRFASLGEVGNAGNLVLSLIGFDPASSINNNDFSLTALLSL